ncbi:alcohol dehydrogenase -like domain-containing protein [Colletotrichum incanum]|uniref:Alcohol dehydrogenase-like domain-containing protein n=1 Tax=Colletotrichum incanum TaxID=1573173 RepID=A0A166NK68_COLIC|nr:alcohol dehydrogenase -like domain-containing protein [Colletotrichum incanum]
MSYNISCLSASMRGVVYDGVPFDMQVRDIPKPIVLSENEVVVRVTTAAICGSDLHVYRGYMGGNPPWGMGHEAIGLGKPSLLSPWEIMS